MNYPVSEGCTSWDLFGLSKTVGSVPNEITRKPGPSRSREGIIVTSPLVKSPYQLWPWWLDAWGWSIQKGLRDGCKSARSICWSICQLCSSTSAGSPSRPPSYPGIYSPTWSSSNSPLLSCWVVPPQLWSCCGDATVRTKVGVKGNAAGSQDWSQPSGERGNAGAKCSFPKPGSHLAPSVTATNRVSAIFGASCALGSGLDCKGYWGNWFLKSTFKALSHLILTSLGTESINGSFQMMKLRPIDVNDMFVVIQLAVEPEFELGWASSCPGWLSRLRLSPWTQETHKKCIQITRMWSCVSESNEDLQDGEITTKL